jgi:GxxExxY protein
MQGLYVERQKAVPLIYEKVKLDCGFRADLVVQDRIVVELKCKDALHPVDEAQLLSHLRLLNVPIGLLVNFHVVLLRDGIRRMVNDYREDDVLEEELLSAKFAKYPRSTQSLSLRPLRRLRTLCG